MLFNQTEIILTTVFACLAIIAVIVFFIVLVVIYQRKMRERQQEIFRSIMETEEKERTRIARELHDSLGASLSAIKMQYSAVSRHLPSDPTAAHIGAMLDDACKEVRSISHQMMPIVLINEGLLVAVDNFTRPFIQLDTIRFEFNSFGNYRRIADQSKELMVYRIIQELINNTLKHAEASHIQLQLAFNQNNLSVVIEDNGKGFEVDEKLNTKAGMGLGNLYSRVNYLKGNINIESEKGKGTSIVINIPLKD